MKLMTGLERLREVALDQHGFVTTAQALEVDVSHALLSMMVSRGRLERVAHGVYRVPQVPRTPFDEYHLAVLWSGLPQCCLSHDTALQVWQISDINPDRIHINVPRGRRIRRAGAQSYSVHYSDLDQGQTDWCEGIPTVNLPTAIEQCIASGVPTYLLRQALDRSSRTSRLTRHEHQRLQQQLEDRDERA